MKPIVLTLLAASLLEAQSPLRITRHAGLPAIYQGVAFALGDLDGDGDLDAIVANDTDPTQLLLNDGKGRFSDETQGRFFHVVPSATRSIDLADIDGDGDLDVLIGNDSALPNRVHLNNGNATFTDVSATALPANAFATKNQVVADLDGDGDVDWFVADAPNCHLYLNDGTGVFADASITHLFGMPFNIGDSSQPAASADIDGDGDIDILIPNAGGLPTLISNVGGGHLTPAATQVPFVVGTCIYNRFVDLDGDGDQDLLLDRTRIVMQNQGDGSFVNVTASAFPVVHQQTNAVFDVDGDGDVDMLSPTVLWRNDGTGHFVGTAIPNTTFPSLLAFYAADVDGDGDIDAPPRMNFTEQVDAPTAPVPGGTYAVDFHLRAGTHPLVVAVCSPVGAQSPMPPFGTLHLVQSTMMVLAVQIAPASPLHFAWQLPNNPAFTGLELHYQAYVDDFVRPPHLTNGIRDVVQ